MIDIEREDFYYCLTPELKERTRNRLIQLNDLGCKEVGIAQFGIPKIFSGLYIESVWHNSDKWFNEYIEWIKELKEKKNNYEK